MSSRPRRAPAARPEQAGGGVKALYVLLGLILIGYAVSLIVRANGASTTWLDGWGASSYELLASLLVLGEGGGQPEGPRLLPRARRGHVPMGARGLCETYAGIHNPSPPTPVLANYLWVGFFPLAYVGVMMLMRQEVRKFTSANYLDGVVATLTCAAAFAAFAFGAIQKAAGDDSVTVAWNLIYPVGRHPAAGPDARSRGARARRAPHALVPDGRRQPLQRDRRYLRAVRQRDRRHALRLLLELGRVAGLAVPVLPIGVGRVAAPGRERAQGDELRAS